MKELICSGALNEDLATALAEGEHNFGEELTAAGWALVMWPDNECPWGRVAVVPEPN